MGIGAVEGRQQARSDAYLFSASSRTVYKQSRACCTSPFAGWRSNMCQKRKDMGRKLVSFLHLAPTCLWLLLVSRRQAPTRPARCQQGNTAQAMLTEETFRAWCQRNQITRETETYIQRIRASQPVRKVRSGVSHVTGRYPSVKMGCSIQFESQYVELWGIYTMERDDDVLEYYDQPTRIQLHYHARSGRKTSPWHTPDFLVIRQDQATFEEWKPESALLELSTRMPERYQRDPAGGWRCPPGEIASAALGLSYRVHTSNEYHPCYIQNLKFLQDFWPHPYSLSQQTESLVLSAVAASSGVSVASFLEA